MAVFDGLAVEDACGEANNLMTPTLKDVVVVPLSVLPPYPSVEILEPSRVGRFGASDDEIIVTVFGFSTDQS